MAKKDQLRQLRAGTVINVTSKKQESDIIKALEVVVKHLEKKFKARIVLRHQSQWHLKDIVALLRKAFPKVDFHYHFDTSAIRPDGGVLFLETRSRVAAYPILIAEVKNQGTNVLREQEGLPRQSKGNAIERLGKNVIGLRTALLKGKHLPLCLFRIRVRLYGRFQHTGPGFDNCHVRPAQPDAFAQ